MVSNNYCKPFTKMTENSTKDCQSVVTPRREKSSPDVVWQRLAVPFEYPVCFTEGLFDTDNSLLLGTLVRLEPHKKHRIAVFIDQGVLQQHEDLLEKVKAYAAVHSQSIELAMAPIIVPGGEAIKATDTHVNRMLEQLAEHHIDRHSFVIAIGGGAVLDAVGFAAAISHRGIRHIRVPTTVLAQNDSGVGVKNGINLFGQKNYLGTFAPPYAVLNDYAFIRSLPARDKISGMAEAVKVALIRDADFYLWLEDNAEALASFDSDAMQYMIKRCAELHMQQIARGGDPFETGSARPLDYGHWAAHKLESLTGYSIRHGEAVAIGLALDTRYSVLTGLLHVGAEQRVCNLLEQLGFSLWHSALESTTNDGRLQILAGLQEFREHLGGQLTITLLDKLGSGIEVNEIDAAMVELTITWLKQQRHINA